MKLENFASSPGLARLWLVALCAILVTPGNSQVRGYWAPTNDELSRQEKDRETQDPSAQKAARDLFDGQSLKGWEITNFGGERPVLAHDGNLVIEAGYPLTGCHWVGDPLPTVNYELSLEAQRIEGNDFFCCLTFPVNDSHLSLVVGGWGGSLVGLSCIDEEDAAHNATKSLRTFKRNQWYRIRVRVEQERVQCWIDDERVIDQNIAGKKISLRNEVHLCRPLGICTFETKATFRAIKLQEFRPENHD
jgi:hypothetical protein